MWGLIKRAIAGRAPEPAQRPTNTVDTLDAEIARGIAHARARRLARPYRGESKRFQHARPKLVELKRAIALQHVEF
jgi:hypothetical protein